MGLQTQQLEVTVNAGRRDRRRLRSRVRSSAWSHRQALYPGFVNQLSQPLIVNRARLAWTCFVMEPVDPLLQESDTPLTHRGTRDLQTLRDCAVGALQLPPPVPYEHASPSQPESSANALSKSVASARLRSTPIRPLVVPLACWHLPFR